MKKRYIYHLDPNFPRLPIKNCKINLIYDYDLSEEDNTLKTIFEECFDEETRNIIFQYYGRALFEQGYEDTQDVMFVLGKGGVGKTTFFGTLNKIFNKDRTISADKLTPENKFAFSSLPSADILLMDEITNATKTFTEKFKEMTGGSSTISIEMKNKNVFDMPSSLIPRMVGIGNKLPKEIYQHFIGEGVVRRFCIIFLKRSILKAKRMTKDFDGVEYPVTINNQPLKDLFLNEDEEWAGTLLDDNFEPQLDEDGNEIIALQGRTGFEIKELEAPGCLEWFVQQIIFNYKHTYSSLLDDYTAREHALMAYCPNIWVAGRWLEPIYNDEGFLDKDEMIPGSELVSFINKEIDEYMLEKVESNSDSKNFAKAIAKGCHIPKSEVPNLTGTNKNFPGETVFFGLKFRDKPKKYEFKE